MLDTGMPPSDVLCMRRELVHQDELYYFNPLGQHPPAGPLRNCVIPILKAQMNGDQTEGWLFLLANLNQFTLSLAICNGDFGQSHDCEYCR
jgi:hypothetical protein